MKFGFLLILFSARVFACDAGCDPHHGQYELQKLVQKISIVGKENRFAYPDSGYTPAQIKKKFSGTGEFHCGGSISGANLVLRNGLLALSSHSFYKLNDDGSCVRPWTAAELKNCYFNAVDSDGEVLEERYYINPATIKLGGADPQNPSSIRGGGHCNSRIVGDDWAVVELRQSVPSSIAQYYDLFDSSVLGDRLNKFKNLDSLKVTVVAMGADNYRGGPVPTICNGIVGYMGIQTDPFGQQHVRHTNSCSGGDGTSGAAVVVEQGEGSSALFGIATSFQNSRHDGEEYGAKNFSTGTVIEGDFKRAILACQNRCPLTQ